MSLYLAVGAKLVNESFQIRTIIMGMERMEGRHTVEQIRIQIRSIVNKLEFNKSKIVSATTDEGSNLVACLKAMLSLVMVS